MPRLRRSSCAAPGIARRRRGRGFQYLDPAGERIDDPEVLERIDALAIPPAWRDVWICMDPRGHLQATGIDAAARKQYLYHEHWRAHRDRLKYDAMIEFGARAAAAAPARRARPGRPSTHGTLSEGRRPAVVPARGRSDQEVVLACAVRLLDLGFFRIGSEDYAERNSSYGLTTMLRRHVSVAGEELVFDFKAKSGQRRVQEIADPHAVAMVATLKVGARATQLLAYRNGRGWTDCPADEVNAYIARTRRGPFTAKDFRTWNATVLAATALAVRAEENGKTPSRARRDREVAATIKTVAAYLGNTPAVCRASYVDPRVIDRFHAGATIAAALRKGASSGAVEAPDLADRRIRRRVETAVLDLIGDA